MTLSTEQLLAYNKWKEGKNIFISGPGGCGKTHFIKYLNQNSNGRKIQICAMTGCAALLLDCNAKTLHSFTGIQLGNGSVEDIVKKIKRKYYLVQNWRKIDCLVVDEVSMLSAPLLELLNSIAQRIRNNLKLFGGIQLVFSGDFFQLPPPNDDNFCFESTLWNKLFPKDSHFIFSIIFRQKNLQFQNLLNQIRVGNIDKENEKLLKKYVGRSVSGNIKPVQLFPKKYMVNHVNNHIYSTIKNSEKEFSLNILENCKRYVENNKPIPDDILSMCQKISKTEKENEIQSLIRNSNWENSLFLKKGTMVMTTFNIDLKEGICNGSQGIITHFHDGYPVVQFFNGVSRKIGGQTIQSEKYPTLCISQLPLCLSWAMTIHKIQGSTLDCAEIDIGNQIFTYGQTYVALSRLKSFDGLFLKNFSKNNIVANPKVIEFYKKVK